MNENSICTWKLFEFLHEPTWNLEAGADLDWGGQSLLPGRSNSRGRSPRPPLQHPLRSQGTPLQKRWGIKKREIQWTSINLYEPFFGLVYIQSGKKKISSWILILFNNNLVSWLLILSFNYSCLATCKRTDREKRPWRFCASARFNEIHCIWK